MLVSWTLLFTQRITPPNAGLRISFQDCLPTVNVADMGFPENIVTHLFYFSDFLNFMQKNA